MSTIEIRPAGNWEECVQCEEIQSGIWRSSDRSDVVPASLLITAQKNGGLLLGAFDGPRMVAFVFGFLAIEAAGEARRLKHCSHILGVLPEYRRLGLAYELKKKQREHLKSQRLDLATWTFDPLQAINAWLNVARLGAIARRYICDAYGEMHDALNVGVASDRFEVEWWLDSRHVQDRLGTRARQVEAPPRDTQPIYEVEFDNHGLGRIRSEAEFQSDKCSLEIPADFNDLKSLDLALARLWRGRTRATFQSAFAQNYTVVEVIRWSDAHRHTAYILERNWLIE
jgi:predicted GNAT superfamily acetyltransferase